MTLPRLLADECCPALVVARLRDHGFDVHYVAEARPGLSDRDVLGLAAEEGRVVVTTDKDFGLLVVRLRHRVEGLILLRLRRVHTPAGAHEIAARVARDAGLLAGRVTTYTEDRVRRRPLLEIYP